MRDFPRAYTQLTLARHEMDNHLAIYDYGFWSLAMTSSGGQYDDIYSILPFFVPSFILCSILLYFLQIDTHFQTPFLYQLCVSSGHEAHSQFS